MEIRVKAEENANLWRCEQWEKTPLLVSLCEHPLQSLHFWYSKRYFCNECGYYYDYDLQECEVI